jgi:type II secretory pathway pseudopilin PulG
MSVRSNKWNRAFTMVELLVGFLILSLILLLVNQFISAIRRGFMHGTVNLERLQEARLAISYLRRDFTSASPTVSEKDPSKIRRFILKYPLELSGNPVSGFKSSPIQISGSSVTFYRFTSDSTTGLEAPKVFPVSYEFQKSAQTLTRTTPDGQKVFKGFRNVQFQCYVHKSSPEIPLLHVEFEIFEERENKHEEHGKPLVLASTIGSVFVTDSLKNRFWNFTTFQQD